MHLDMVREGIMLYGLYPSNEVSKESIKLKECMEFKSYIASISELKKGEGISYGHTFIAQKDMKIATINLGYSDGLFRSLGNKGEVIINDQRRSIVGRICMNMFMVDIMDMEDVSVEDEVIIFGKSENNFISIDEVALKAGTISYEIVCRTGYSVPRVYIKNGEIIEIESDLIVEKR
jgi:alanine racemase